MKLSKIGRILKREKRIITVRVGGTQWIGSGSCFYPINNMPQLDENALCTLFEIPAEKREDFTISEISIPAGVSFDDSTAGEMLINKAPMEIIFEGRVLSVLKTQQGALFLNSRYLVPFTDEKNGFELYERTDGSGRQYIAVKSGFILLGIIMPVSVNLVIFAKELEELQAHCLVRMANNEERAEQEAYQMGLIGEKEEDE